MPETLQALITDVGTWGETLDPVSAGIQIAVALLGLGLAWLVNRAWSRYLEESPAATQTGIASLTLRGSKRVVFPFAMLAMVYLGRAILDYSGRHTALLDVLVPLLLSLAGIRLLVYLLRQAFPPSPALRAWEQTIAITIWSGVALHLLGWLPPVLAALDAVAISTGSTRLSLLGLLKLALSLGGSVLLALWLSQALERRLMRAQYLGAGARIGVAKVMKVVVVALAVLIALNAVGMDLTAFTIFGGALGVGLGFGLQRIASNFISGFILLFDRSIRPGDVISVGQNFGWVQALHARYVVVRDRDGVDRLIPNENLVTSEVINWSYGDRNVRIKIPVQISYADDPEEAMQVLIEAARNTERALQEPAPVARLMGFGDNGINLELRVWLEDPEEGLNNVRSEINLKIWREFKRRGITIPFPQRDLYLKTLPPGDGGR